MSLGLLDLFVIGATAFTSAAVFWGLLFLTKKPDGSSQSSSQNHLKKVSFLLEAEAVIDATPQAIALLGLPPHKDLSRSDIIAVLENTFPTLSDELAQCQDKPIIVNACDGTSAWLELRPANGRIQLCLGAIEGTVETAAIDIREANEDAELLTLREMVNHAPVLMWRSDPTGRLVWANDAYLTANDACSDILGVTPTLPSSPLFKELEDVPAFGNSVCRTSLKVRNDDAPRWYEVSTVKTDTGAAQFAINVDPIVRAELAQRKFMQTLSQTFAQLSIGLAIFDRRRQLATFNPALFDMTGLPIEFLSARPTLDAFLDHLRELRMLPEPKDYATWREQFMALEAESKIGGYSESWNLPDGQTFQVTGRPYPDGAFALLFEDISAEISLTRRFRSEIETSQAVMDKIEDAIVVFSNGGNLVLSNEAYNTLWDGTSNVGFGQCDLRGELSKWQERCTPSRIWTNLREFTTQMGLRKPWTDTAILDDGRWISCHADQISGGMTMVRFRFPSSPSATVQKLTQVDPALNVMKR